MARVFPATLPIEIRANSGRDAECQLFDALSALLGPDYFVFYSVSWLTRSELGGAAEGEADFVIAHPTRGILVIEVKGGIISRDGRSGTWLSRSRSGEVFEIKDPVAQARRNKHNLADKLASIPPWRGRRPKIAHAVAFPHCQRASTPLGLDCPGEIALFGDDLVHISQSVDRVFAFWTEQHVGSVLDSTAMGRLVSLLSPTVELQPAVPPLASVLGAAEARIASLTEKQDRVLKGLGRNRRVAICGGAGTGKTMLALSKARQLAAEGFRTLLTCYNRPLADYLKVASRGTADLTVLDFHQLCWVATSQAGLQLSVEQGKEFWDEAMPNALAEAVSRVPGLRFDAVIVDEGQDFADSWWLPLQMVMTDPDAGIIYVFYDDNQRLYRQQLALPSNLIPFCLSENLRNTRQIHTLASRFYSGGELIAAGPDGSSVEYIEVATEFSARRELSRVLHRLLKGGGVAARDIAVLTGKSVETSALAADGRFGAFKWTRDQLAEPESVLFESIARFKGLERQAVVLVELENMIASAREESLYVGLSRARAHLSVIGSADVLKYTQMGLQEQHLELRPSEPAERDYLRALLGEKKV
jgi:predicted ATPase